MITKNKQSYELNSIPRKYFFSFDWIEHLISHVKDPFSYNIFKNPFAVFGLLWGLPVPSFFLYFHTTLTDKSFTQLISNHPLHWFFLIHPILFAIFFGMIGSFYFRYHEKLKFRATHDELTELLTHTQFHRSLEEYIASSDPDQDQLAIVMIDLDHFKAINDNYGHQAGDKVLKRSAEILESVTRSEDYLCRYGGEEFALAFPGTSSGEAFTVVERIRETVATDQTTVPKQLTLSAGVSQYPDDGEQLDEVINRADTCLYKAKTEGRNRTVYSPQLKNQREIRKSC